MILARERLPMLARGSSPNEELESLISSSSDSEGRATQVHGINLELEHELHINA